MIARLALASCLVCTAAAEPGWVEVAAKPLAWQDALTFQSKRRSLILLDTPLETRLQCYIGIDHPEILGREKLDLKIQWLAGEERPVDFTRSIRPANGMVRSTYRLRKTTVTRTFLASDEENAVFVHLIADQPGALAFRVSLSILGAGEPKIEDRRQLVLPTTADHMGAHLWVLPFESDVATEGHSISVQGEGEALIIITYALAADGSSPLAEVLTRLGKRYDPEHLPPDPGRIWRGVLETQRKSTENSP